MGPIEIVFFALIIMFALVGVVRGFLKEIGVTTVLVFLLFILTYFKNAIMSGLTMLVDILKVQPPEGTQADLVRFSAYGLLIAFVAFISYQGETFTFEGRPLSGPLGMFMGLIAGFLNGYLIVGSLWYYLNALNYPISLFGLFEQPLSPLATSILPILPEALIPPFGFFAIGAFLIFMRVIR